MKAEYKATILILSVIVGLVGFVIACVVWPIVILVFACLLTLGLIGLMCWAIKNLWILTVDWFRG